ncbi:MAG: excinuclease ABC subunit UvrA, partial [Verrucomicrobiales bacterium]|nr:excinuclease ABC subunit UvrA [Verrucomicrobiales bacterium]
MLKQVPMLEPTRPEVIRLRGVRQNNLKNFDLDLPLRRLIVITGLSGSGKSSLAFDTLFAEGQRRYIETFSPYARQFFDRMDKPQVDSVEGIPPAIAIEQRNTVRTTRSTVGTMTEICDYMKVLWPHIAQLHCRGCGKPVRKDTPQSIWETLTKSEIRNPKPETNAKQEIEGGEQEADVIIAFDLPLSEKLSLTDSLALIAKQGYQRLLVNGEIVRVDEAAARLGHAAARLKTLTVIQDRLRLAPENRARFVEACEQAYHFGKGRLAVHVLTNAPTTSAPVKPRNAPLGQPFTALIYRFSNTLHCAECDIEYREPSPALFSFNHPLGACPTCKGFGRIITIDYNLAIPDRSLSLAQGAIKPWRTGFSAECQQDLLKFCKARGVPTNVPFAKLKPEHQRWVIEGDEDYGIDEAHEWPYAWYGLKGYFKWLESKAYKMHVRVLLSRYRAYTTCPDCKGARLKPEALLYRLPIEKLEFRRAAPNGSLTPNGKCSITLAEFYALPIRDAFELVDRLAKQYSADAPAGLASTSTASPIRIALEEVRARLRYLVEVGLGYLTLDRPTRTLSGGETERVNLTACLGTRLVNTLFVLDEPSVGLHPRDTDRLVRILKQLRDAGNTVVVVEHEPGVIRAADMIVDLGPGSGEAGGHIVFQGTFDQLLKHPDSLTGKYLSGRLKIEVPQRRPVARTKSEIRNSQSETNANPEIENRKLQIPNHGWLTVRNAAKHNLKNITVSFPLGRFVCVTGVSGSGKSTLVREVLYPALVAKLGLEPEPTKASDRLDTGSEPENGGGEEVPLVDGGSSAEIEGWEHLGRVVLVDQSGLGKTPRSNPAVYIGAFDHIRELFAQTEAARQRGLTASAFSFNSAQGQCERCRGAGFEKIEMQFLSDVFIRCPDCNGRRYR